MKKTTDVEVLKKKDTAQIKKKQKGESFTNFNKKFNKYKQAKTSQQPPPSLACRPYIEIFRQPQK